MYSSLSIGVGIFITRRNQLGNLELLLGERLNSHGEGEYSCPGGAMEIGESISECATRELKEEVGDELVVKNLNFLCLANIDDYPPRQWINIGMTADYVSGEAQLCEPEKCKSWDWYELENLPKPLFKPIEIYLEAIDKEQVFFD